MKRFETAPATDESELEVPLVEAHVATRKRWTANLTTFSDHERLDKEGPPYAEYMFKADVELVLKRFKEHCTKRGHPKWVSVATSEKGSYTTEDVLAFLETHLPQRRSSGEAR